MDNLTAEQGTPARTEYELLVTVPAMISQCTQISPAVAIKKTDVM